jgi:hypothetical protein
MKFSGSHRMRIPTMAALLLFIFSITACVPESQYPLSAVDSARYDKRLQGVWTAGTAGADPLLDCWYMSKGSTGSLQQEMEHHDNCAAVQNGTLSLRETHMKNLVFDRYGLASVPIRYSRDEARHRLQS